MAKVPSTSVNEAVNRARRLRREATTPERVLWNVLRGGQLTGLKFRRQHPIGPFIADFYRHSAAIVVELDGMSHDDKREYNQNRNEYMQRQGLRVLRILNEDVMSDLDAVARGILMAAGVKLG
jgi:very-short-patch-repair endonuclease